MPLAEQIAALDHFGNQLLKADALPLALAAFADALHRLQHAQRAVKPLQQRGAAGAGGGTGIEAAFATQLRQRLLQRQGRVDVPFLR